MTYLDVVRADRPHLLWPLDEGGGTVVRDLSGNGRAGTITGSPQLRGGSSVPGYAAPRWGNNKYAEASATTTLGPSFAVEAWYEKVTHLAGYPGDINSVIGDLVSAANGCLIRYDTTSNLRFYYGSSGGLQSILSSIVPSHRRPVHIVGSVRSGGRARLIVNGRVVADAATVGTPAFSSPMRVGRSEDGRYFDGPIGWAAAYNSEISPDAARRHYEAGMRDGDRRRRLGAA